MFSRHCSPILVLALIFTGSVAWAEPPSPPPPPTPPPLPAFVQDALRELPGIMREIRSLRQDLAPVVGQACALMFVDPDHPDTLSSQAATRTCDRLQTPPGPHPDRRPTQK